MSRVSKSLEQFEVYLLQLEQRINDLEGDQGYLDEAGFHPHAFVDRKALACWRSTLQFIYHDNWAMGCRACGRALGFNYEFDHKEPGDLGPATWWLAAQRDKRRGL